MTCARDGIAVPHGEARMAAAARLLAVLGVTATVPDDPGSENPPGLAQPGGGWISGPST